MKTAYPVIFTKLSKGFAVHSPDFSFDTQGNDLAEAIDMARDAIGIMGIDMEDDGKPFPEPTSLDKVEHEDGAIVTLIDSDLTEYRKASERRSVRRNVTLPSWLDREADKAGINVSSVLQEALKIKLGVEA